MILKTTRLSITSTFRVDDNEIISDDANGGSVSKGIDSGCRFSTSKRKFNKFKSRNISINLVNSGRSKAKKVPKFLISKFKEVFNYLKQVFPKSLIFRHFDSEYHIGIETNTLGYVIRRVIS